MRIMKRVIIFCALILVSSCAWAEIHEFKYFYIDIPEGWSVKEDGVTINIKADDNSASLMIRADSLNGESLDKLAAEFANELGAGIVNVDSEDDYIFEFQDVEKQAILTGGDDEDFYMLIAASGFEQTVEPESGDVLLNILDSLEMK
ncbi:MAG: hypothetical protein IJQ56_06960 [Synergistaceae bacterium]|nr:hypothetical protein [Synergistaceae bacterium]MBR0204086.1 hypothetical protein [Synergistaceae bacterium]